MTPKPISHYLVLALLALGTALAAWNWYLQPGRAVAWATGLLAFPLLWGCMALTLRSVKDEEARRRAASAMRGGAGFAALILVMSLGAKLGVSLGLLDDGDFSRRTTMVIVGAFFVVTGNTLPKQLTPLSALQCDGAKTQAFQRFAGRMWVLVGVVFAVAWLTLPVDVARPVTVLAVVAMALAVAMQILRLRRMPTRV